MARVVFSITHFKKSFNLFTNISFLFLLCFFLTIHIYSASNFNLLHQPKRSNSIINIFSSSSSSSLNLTDGIDNCSGIYQFHDHQAKCEYVRSNRGCGSRGYIDYLQLFYCICGSNPFLGYSLLILWLILLFYLLGNTAANYFCSSLESLSKILKLSPTIAGVTLLSLGNGAPDVFSSIVSFMGKGSGGVGLNSILGGAFFVSSIVVGIISISISSREISVDKSSFIRDVLFFILALCSLLVIVVVGKINIWGAIAFVSLYFIYVLIVATAHLCRKKDKEVSSSPFAVSSITRIFLGNESTDEIGEFGTPLLGYGGDEKLVSIEKGGINGNEDGDDQNGGITSCEYFRCFLYVIELPLYLPRRMTIPVVSEERWSKSFAVISVTLAPVLLVALWDSQRENLGYNGSLVIYLSGGLVGIVFGTIAFVTTKFSRPPKRCLLPWLVGGFLMSVTWSYIIAEELVALLISLGIIFEISPSILGLTVLAWGNSLGDLIANVAMAMNGEQDGAQIAISGCYAGPIFNTIMGLGMSFVFSAWSQYPSSFDIPRDTSLYETIGFLMAGLLWALVILPRKNMKLDRFLGGGLLAIYLCFLCVRLTQTLGGVPLHGPL
ncbi:Sodium/calcium exchanger membrane region [Macleaya cordata]|uniref:Sodium/calcium exchanger membrane region n=1 Tax=Macleaya cordata TaxID=56857 RepID=A0A200QMA3_MACCD|nr:Sodium/calcium exchanger membrane region [Macleaya cordata]